MTPEQRAAMEQALEALKNAYWPTEPSLMPAHNIKECGDAITALDAVLKQPLAMQVHPSEFMKIVAGKENMTGIPAYFAEWPNHD